MEETEVTVQDRLDCMAAELDNLGSLQRSPEVSDFLTEAAWCLRRAKEAINAASKQ